MTLLRFLQLGVLFAAPDAAFAEHGFGAWQMDAAVFAAHHGFGGFFGIDGFSDLAGLFVVELAALLVTSHDACRQQGADNDYDPE